MTDIDELERLTIALGESEDKAASRQQLLSVALDSLPQAIAICDADGALWYLNAEGRRINELEYEAPPDKWADALTLERYDGEPLSIHDYPLARALEGEVSGGVLDWLVGGRHVTVDLAQPIQQDGKILGAVCLFHEEPPSDAMANERRS